MHKFSMKILRSEAEFLFKILLFGIFAQFCRIFSFLLSRY